MQKIEAISRQFAETLQTKEYETENGPQVGQKSFDRDAYEDSMEEDIQNNRDAFGRR